MAEFIDEALSFLATVFDSEREVLVAVRLPDLDDYNLKFEQLLGYVSHSSTKFGLNYLAEPINTFLDTDYGHLEYEPPPVVRRIYKVSEYSHWNYDSLAAAYISAPNPPEGVETISECFFVGARGAEIRIVARYLFDDLDMFRSTWQHHRGDDDIRFELLGKPIEIRRMLIPSTESESEEEYYEER